MNADIFDITILSAAKIDGRCNEVHLRTPWTISLRKKAIEDNKVFVKNNWSQKNGSYNILKTCC